MRHGLAAACLTFSLCLRVACNPSIADPSVKELAARTEVRPIETLTLTDQQFLTGDKSAAKAAVIAGELRLPQGAAGRLPAVVLMHGSGGAGRARGVLVEDVQRNGDRIVRGGQLLRARVDQRVGEPGACWAAST